MESGSWKVEAALGALVLGVLGLFVWLSFAVGSGAPRDAVRYVLLFDSALGLSEDNAVAIAGVKVGVVDSIGIEGRKARVVVAIQKDVPMFGTARGAVRAKTLLGEKYVDLDPGEPTGPRLAPGSTIVENVPTVEIDQVIRSTAQLVASLNVITPPLETAVGRIDEMLKGSEPGGLKQELATTIADLGVLIRETSKGVQGSSADVQAIVKMTREKGPSVLDRMDKATARIDDLLAAVDPAQLASATDRVDTSMENVEKFTIDMKTAMVDVREAARRLAGGMV
jgi:phospholipid/cholesterol/gamma-HCH transport system substrate-binding protein